MKRIIAVLLLAAVSCSLAVVPAQAETANSPTMTLAKKHHHHKKHHKQHKKHARA